MNHRLVCGNGAPWPCGPCRGCLDEAAALDRAFDAAVARGEFDRDGFTASDRAARERRAAEQAQGWLFE